MTEQIQSLVEAHKAAQSEESEPQKEDDQKDEQTEE